MKYDLKDIFQQASKEVESWTKWMRRPEMREISKDKIEGNWRQAFCEWYKEKLGIDLSEDQWLEIERKYYNGRSA